MGSYFGHCDEASLFLAIALWWIYKAFPAYIKSRRNGDQFICQTSYSWEGRPKIAIESFSKMAFPLAGLCGELFEGTKEDHTFFDEDGNFLNLNRLQHISIYGMFFLHGLIDFLGHLGVKLPRGYSGVTMALAFAWYGLSFIYHEQMDEKDGMERMIHILPTYFMFGVSMTTIMELVRPTWFMAHVAKMFFVLVLGTWFWHTSAIFYNFTPFPGNHLNPDWDHTDPRNAHFLVSLMGFHLCLNLVAIVIFYLLAVGILKLTGQLKPETENRKSGLGMRMVNGKSI